MGGEGCGEDTGDLTDDPDSTEERGGDRRGGEN